MTHQELVEELSKNNRFQKLYETINITSTQRIHTFAISYDNAFKMHYLDYNLLDPAYSNEGDNRKHLSELDNLYK